MNLFDVLKGVPHEVGVGAVYLVARYLSHGLNREQFKRQLNIEVQPANRQQVLQAATTILKVIEEAEGCAVLELSLSKRLAYIEKLDALRSDMLGLYFADPDVEKALEALRSVA